MDESLETCATSTIESGASSTVLGVDVGGTKTAVVEGTRRGEILQRHEAPTEGRLPFDEAFGRIAELLRRAAHESERGGRRVAAVSASLPGPLKISEGVLLDPPNLPGWHGARVKDRLAELFPALPVFTEHDGNAGALAEFGFGAGRTRAGLRHLIFLTCGTGMGAGLIVNGEIVHGATDTAGEVGHLRLAMNGPALYGKAGSWEGLASGAGMVALACAMFPSRWSAATPIRELVGSMLEDDADALAVAAEAGHWLGRGMALLMDALNPEMIVLGSLAVVLGERLLGPARRALTEEALPRAVAACEVVPAALGARVGDTASLMAALTSSRFGDAAEE